MEWCEGWPQHVEMATLVWVEAYSCVRLSVQSPTATNPTVENLKKNYIQTIRWRWSDLENNGRKRVCKILAQDWMNTNTASFSVFWCRKIESDLSLSFHSTMMYYIVLVQHSDKMLKMSKGVNTFGWLDWGLMGTLEIVFNASLFSSHFSWSRSR